MAQNIFPFPKGRAMPSDVIASGDGLLGEVFSDADGKKYRVVLSTDGALLDGAAVEFKDATQKHVIATSSASGIGGGSFAGLVRASLESDLTVAQDEVCFVQFAGQGEALVSSASIVRGDMLVVSASGTLIEATDAADALAIAKSDDVDPWVANTPASGITVTLKG